MMTNDNVVTMTGETYNGEIHRGLGHHMKAATDGIAKRKALYQKNKRPFDPNAHIFLWRNNISYQDALLQMMLALLKPYDEGETVQRWRSQSVAAQYITRVFFAHMIAHRRPVTISDIESRMLEDTGVEYDRKTIRDIMNNGVELGLLAKLETESTHRYMATNLLNEEMFERMVIKITDPRVIHFARLVLTYHTMTKIGTETTDRESDGQQTFDPYRTVQEELNDGTYNEIMLELIAREEKFPVSED